MSEQDRTTPSYFVPAEPFRRLVREAVAALPFSDEEDWDRSIALTPEAQVGMQIWGRLDGSYSELAAEQRVRNMLVADYDSMDFDTADRIVCGTVGPGLWVADLEYAKIYQEVNLEALDVARPTCDEAATELARELLSRYGSGRKAASALRISRSHFYGLSEPA